MAQDMESVRTGVARLVQGGADEDLPQIITPVQNVNTWEWALQVTPPALSGTLQEKWVKVAAPLRVPALAWLWLTWHWTRFAAATILLGLVIILITVR